MLAKAKMKRNRLYDFLRAKNLTNEYLRASMKDWIWDLIWFKSLQKIGIGFDLNLFLAKDWDWDLTPRFWDLLKVCFPPSRIGLAFWTAIRGAIRRSRKQKIPHQKKPPRKRTVGSHLRSRLDLALRGREKTGQASSVEVAYGRGLASSRLLEAATWSLMCSAWYWHFIISEHSTF